jgi:L-arabinokinase
MSKIAGLLKDFYASHRQKVFQATAPGRLDVMGGVSDYSGSLLIQKPLMEETSAYIAFREDTEISIKSVIQGEILTFSADYYEIAGEFKVPNYDYAREQILKHDGGDWAVYIVGCILMLNNTRKLKPEGLDILITTEVPIGKGLGSSASLEVAVLKAIVNGLSLDVSEYEIPIIAQKAENLIAGAACGLMDQLTAYSTKKNKLIPIICQPHTVFHPIDIPDQIYFVGINSGVTHAVSGSSYTDVRTAAFMGYSMIALNSGATLRDLEVAKETGNYANLPYGGYLANISPSEFEQKFLSNLPDTLSGEDFLDKYKAIIDPLSFIDRDKEYIIKNATRHPVYEHFRVKIFAQILRNYTTEFQNYSNRLQLMGELMYQSHQSYTDCGLGHEKTDRIVEMVKAKGEKKGLYGARISGGGNGGTVCILCAGLSGPESVQDVFKQYAAEVDEDVALFA